MQKKTKTILGFTLVEIVIVLAIIGVLLPIVFSILFTITRQQTKIYRLAEAKQQGDFVLAFMKSQIRDYGNKIYKDDTELFETCNDSVEPDNTHTSQTGLDFYIKKRDTANGYVQFYTESFPTGDASDTSNPQRLWFSDSGLKQILTTDNVRIANFEISCYRRTITQLPFVFVSFIIYYKTNLATAKPEDLAVLNYKGVIKLQ